jgi:FAD/FMN-containing dehydrogenase
MSAEVDALSGTIRVAAATSWGDVEAQLATHALTLGPIPGWLRSTTVSESLGQPWPQRPSPRYGALRESTLAVTAALPGGLSHAPVAPRRATGPDLPRVSFGAQGRGGQLREVVLQAWPQPSKRASLCVGFSDWTRARAAALGALRSGVRPALWCLRAEGEEVVLRALFWGDDELASAVARFADGFASERDSDTFFEGVLAPGASPRAARGSYRDRDWLLAVHDDDEIWDLRPEGVTLYADGTAAPSPQDAPWNDLAARLFAAVSGGTAR